MKTPRTKTIREAYTTVKQSASWQGSKDGSPFNTMNGLGSVADIISAKTTKDSELEGHAGKIMPYPLDRSLEQMASIYDTIIRLKSTFLLTLQCALLTDAERKVIRNQMGVLDKMLNSLGSMSGEVEKIYL